MKPTCSHHSTRLVTRGVRAEPGCDRHRPHAVRGLGFLLVAALMGGCGSDSAGPTAPPPPALQPATVAVNEGDTQMATVGTPVPMPPSVRIASADGTPMSGVAVRFDVVVGGGSVVGSPALSDASGVASLDRWTLGTATGRNGLRATVSGVSSVSFEAVATPDVPKTLTAVQGNGQTATAGSALPVSPAVTVRDRFANPIPGVTVVFTVDQGGGSVTGPTTSTDGFGVATVGSWTLGSAPGANSLTATVADGSIAGNPVTFNATGTGAGPSPAYDIVVRFNSGSSPTAAQQQAFETAEARWEEVVIGDLPDVSVNRPAGTCSSTSPINETVDDLLIFVTIESIDGPGGVLGSAGPCLIRSGANLPLAGSMRLDTADLAGLESSGLLDEIILHEMGHVLGIGSLWNLLGLLADPSQSGGLDPHFTGPQATAAFNSIGGSGYAGARVPVEDTGGSGTADAHWRESIFDKEVMTGWINSGTNPLGDVTVSALLDHGYTVDPSSADPMSLSFSSSIVPRPGTAPVALLLADDVAHGPIEVVDARGRTERVLPR